MKIAPKYIACAAAFLVVEIMFVLWLDLPISMWERNLATTHPNIVDFFRAYTDFGKSTWYLWPAAIGVVMCLAGRKLVRKEELRVALARLGHRLSFFFVAMALSGIITDVIKPILGRARPVAFERHNLYGFTPFSFDATMNSMPSGHSTTAASLTVLLILLLPRWRVLWVVIGCALVLSRVMVNAHYVSDTLAGCAVGILTTLWISRYRTSNGMLPVLNGIFPIDKTLTNL